MALGRESTTILVGAVALVAWAVFIVFAFNVNHQDVSGYSYYATFNRIDGLPRHADVRLAGIRIGEVVAEDFLPQTDRARVTLVIKPDVMIPSDSAAIVASDGFFGSKYIKIDPGGDTEALAPGSAFSYTQDSVDFERLLQRMVADAEAQKQAAPPGKTPSGGAAAGNRQ